MTSPRGGESAKRIWQVFLNVAAGLRHQRPFGAPKATTLRSN